MELRISNGYSQSVPFTAENAPGFALALGQAWREYTAGDTAQLHIRVCGDWIAPSYRIARSAQTYSSARVLPNMPVIVIRGESPAVHLWEWCQQSYADGNRFNQMVGDTAKWAAKP